MGANAGEFKSAKLLICQHYDEQVREADIYAERLLEQLHEINKSPVSNLLAEAIQTDFYGSDKRCIRNEPEADDDDEEDDEEEPYRYPEPYSHKYSYEEQLPVEIDLIEYASRTPDATEYVETLRMCVVNELRKVEQETLVYYEKIKSQLSIDRNRITNESLDELCNAIFARKFCFVVNIDCFKHMEYGVFGNQFLFNMHIVVLDFYLSPAEIDLFK